MDELKICLTKLRRANIHHQMFVPELSLHKVMTKDVIFDALRVAQIGAHRREEIATKVHQSGRKIFAILILIGQAVDIVKFIEADGLEDVKLPFSNKFLKEEIGMPDTNEFVDKQWEFTSPTFQRGTLNRRLKEKAILPFTMHKIIDEGAFGPVYIVELDQDHQKLDRVFPKKFAQKELQSTDDHRIELENLSILNHIKHPYIAELLASYTYRDKHNLLFPLADGGTLEALLQTERQKTVFQSDQTFLIALVGLSSAIEHVHDFVDRKLDFNPIGFHHDLRPRNILVSKASLILADFGLSTFKEPSQDSAASFRNGMDDYLAPECEDYKNNFHDLIARRSSGIWSFGCIITEIATYMAHGENAVKEFRNKREFKVRGFTRHVFHHGPCNKSGIVEDWLSMIEQSSIQSCTMLVALARRMLVMEESDRPKASEITSQLQRISLSQVAAEIDRLFSHVETKTNSLDAVIERNRFAAWRYAIGILDFETSTDFRTKLNNGKLLTFDSLLKCLGEFRAHLEWVLSQEDSIKISFSHLCYLNDGLVEKLDVRQQESSRSFFRISMSDNERLFTEVENEARGLSFDKEIRMRANLKHMTTLAMNHIDIDTDKKQIDSRFVQIMHKFGEHRIGEVTIGEHKVQVLVEWRKYGHQSPIDPQISQELFVRLNAIVKQLSDPKPNAVLALHCRGYFHDENRQAFGILYDIPRSISPQLGPVEPITLHQLIAQTTGNMKLWPDLDDKFRLAFTLAKSVLEFHLVGWLHKGLTALNVAFFPPKGAAQDQQTAEPYIIGFNQSRQDDPSAFSEPIMSAETAGYQHPTYRKKARGYRPEYDYYSLGIILMEIAYWRPFKEIAGITRGRYSKENDQVLQKRIPGIRKHMGRDYCDAVSACINGDFNSLKHGDENQGNKGAFISFEIQVLSRLSKYLVSFSPDDRSVVSGSSENFQKFANPHSTNESETIQRALSQRDFPLLEFLLQSKFEEVAQGEFSWLHEVDHLGYTRAEIAQLLFEELTDSPWIFLEPGFTIAQEMKLDFHLPNCAHTVVQAAKKSSTLSTLASFQYKTMDFGNVSRAQDTESLLQQVAQSAGLAGIVPSTGNLDRWVGRVIFEHENTISRVIYGSSEEINTEGDLIKCCIRALQGLSNAIGYFQQASCCCDSFTILKSLEHENAKTIKMVQIRFELINQLHRSLLEILSYPIDTSSTSSFQRCTLIVAKVLSILGIPYSTETEDVIAKDCQLEDRSNTIHSYCLAVQALCLGFLAYCQAHCGKLQPCFLDTAQQKVLLQGSKFDPGSTWQLQVELLDLSCMGDMLHDSVLVFSAFKEDSKWLIPPTEYAYDLLATPQDLLDTWGPGHFVSLESEPASGVFCAISIRGGTIKAANSEGGRFHWSRDTVYDADPQSRFNAKDMLLVGGSVTIKHDCPSDKRHLWENTGKEMSTLGTSEGLWKNAERQAGFQAGEYVSFVFQNVWAKEPGTCLKDCHLEQEPLSYSFLQSKWGLQISCCTGVARRVSLCELLADVMPDFVESLFPIPPLWEKLKQDHGIIKAFSGSSLQQWLRNLDEDCRLLALRITRYILSLLRHTGIDYKGEYLTVSWPQKENPFQCLKLNCDKKNFWTRLLADSVDCATFAYITPHCLETTNLKCRGSVPKWYGDSALLDTAVCRHITSTNPTQNIPVTWTLKDKETYCMGKPDLMLMIRVERADPGAVPRLYVSPSLIPKSFIRRMFHSEKVRKALNLQKLRERQWIGGQSESVLILVRD